MNSRDSSIVDLLDIVKSWGRVHPKIIGVLAYGSLARGDADDYSDIDLVLVIDSTESAFQIKGEFKELFDVTYSFDSDKKHALLLRKPPTKLEYFVVPLSDLDSVKRFFVETRFEDTHRAVLLDKSGLLESKLANWTASKNPFGRSSLVNIANDFLYYYEGIHAPFHRGDTYRAYFQYSLAFFKLSAFVGASSGMTDHLYLPKQLTNRVPIMMMDALRALSPIMDPLEIRRRKTAMLSLFQEAVKNLGLEKEFPKELIEEFRLSIESRFPLFWQLRDVGRLEGLQKGVFFRGATLSSYPKEEVASWIRSAQIKTIIDLREDEEVNSSPYDPSILGAVNYIRLPVTTRIHNESNDSALDVYSKLLKYYAALPREESFKSAVRNVVENLSDSSNLPLLLHCAGGTDRTGMIVATVLEAIGVDRAEIGRDYLMSSRYVDIRLLDAMFATLQGNGTSFTPAISEEDLKLLRCNLLNQ
ncbi:MAG: tyrosine-protein phosphatase [Thaumarchaeota archaeon]|nr:tyrosine-protein phosphatase [Nitrososphaerota archaeon]